MSEKRGSADLIFVATPTIDGCAYFAPVGLKAQIRTCSEPIPKGFEHLGYLSEDGFNVDPKNEAEGLKVFGGSKPRTLGTDHDVTITCEFDELLNPSVQKIINGKGNVLVEQDGDIERMIIQTNAKLRPKFQFIFDTFDQENDDMKVRYWAPYATVTSTQAIPHKQGEPSKIGVTITCLEHPVSKQDLYTITERIKTNGNIGS